jgi:hypothetical protein
VKEDINKDMESLKESNRNLVNKKFLSKMKDIAESNFRTLEQVEDRISGLEDKIDIKKRREEYIDKRLKI